MIHFATTATTLWYYHLQGTEMRFGAMYIRRKVRVGPCLLNPGYLFSHNVITVVSVHLLRLIMGSQHVKCFTEDITFFIASKCTLDFRTLFLCLPVVLQAALMMFAEKMTVTLGGVS